tara:strand:+ start:33 stop:596 length:564 start_codon:yes stop_codon:yes gene_type:complete
MKRFLFMLAIASLCCVTSCNSEGGQDNGGTVVDAEEPKNEAIKGMIMVSLLEYGLPLWVTVPDTLSAHLEIIERDWGQVDIRSGKNYQISIAEGGDLELKKSDIQADLLFTDSKILVEETEGIVYSQGVKDDEYFKPINHFYAVKNINGIDYEFKDVDGDYKYTEKVVIKMFEASKVAEVDDRKPQS